MSEKMKWIFRPLYSVAENLGFLFDSIEERRSALVLFKHVDTFFPLYLMPLPSKLNGLLWATPFLRWKEMYGRRETFIAAKVCHRADMEQPIYVN
jgi:hypothetical protein